MHTKIKKGGEHFFQIHTQANSNLGIFLLFLGIIGSAPLYYLTLIALNQPSDDLRPAIWFGLFFVVLGLYFIFYSKKSFWVSNKKISVKDSFFKKTLTYSCQVPDISIRLKNYEIEHRAAPMEIWQVFLACGKREFLIHQRANSQLEMRQLAETLAKIIECPFEDMTFDEEGIVINSADLDLPYKDRVLKYPQLLGKAIKEPSKVYFDIKEINNTTVFSWGIMTTRLVMDMMMIFGLVLVLSFIPFERGEPSFFEMCVANKDFAFYYTIAALIVFILFILSGYRHTLTLTPKHIELNEYIWAIPYFNGAININKIEEINMYTSMRGSKVQIISDKRIIDINLYNQENARWMVYLIRQHLLTA